jgi:REP element-mobilizing transposase RayT
MEKPPRRTESETDFQVRPETESGSEFTVHEFQTSGITSPLISTVKPAEPSLEDFEQEGVILEPVSPRPYELSYACLVIPRFSTHFLKGDLVPDLQKWMVQVCISFNWRLDALEVQPEYMQWLLSVPAAIPPAHFLRVIRAHTSRGLLSGYPRFKRENLSTDFWAPGNLVIVGTRPHSRHMIDEFIRLTRQHQGLPTDRRR